MIILFDVICIGAWQKVYAMFHQFFSDIRNCFLYPVTIVKGGGIKICPYLSVCPSVCPSIHHTLQYRVCVFKCSHIFQWTFLRPCILIVDIRKMSIWVFDGAKSSFDRNTTF